MSGQGSNGNGRFDRISDQTKGLVEDVKEWVDLRVKLVQLDIEERVETIANEAISTLLVIAVAAGSLLFLLIAAAFAMGALFGSNALGFLAVGVVLAIVSWSIARFKPKFVRKPVSARRSALRGADEKGDRLLPHRASAPAARGAGPQYENAPEDNAADKSVQEKGATPLS